MKYPIYISLTAAAVFTAAAVNANVEITEIMYNPDGNDSGREWVEVQNSGESDVDLGEYKLTEVGRGSDGGNLNHGISTTSVSSSSVIPTGGFAVISNDAKEPNNFISDFPSFGGIIFHSSFSLGNTGGIIAISRDDSAVDQVSYSSGQGGSDDGNSLQKIDGAWKSSLPTPGAANFLAVGQDSASLNDSGSSVQNSSAGGVTALVLPLSVKSDSPQMNIPSTVIAGSSADFQASGPSGSRFYWNFGDGSVEEGGRVSHKYIYPGKYIVVADVVSSGGRTSLTSETQAIAFPFLISSVSDGLDGYVEVENSSTKDLSFSGWKIESGGNIFTVPENSIIPGKGRVKYAARIMGFGIDGARLRILFSDYKEAFVFKTVKPPVTDLVNFAVSAEPKPMPVFAPKVIEPTAVSAEISDNEEAVAASSTVPARELSASSSSQSADVISAFDEDKSGKWWWFGGGGVILLAIGSVVFLRRGAL